MRESTVPKAILQNGQIEPVEPLPQEWQEGERLRVEKAEDGEAAIAEIDRDFALLAQLCADSDPAEEQRLSRAIEEAPHKPRRKSAAKWGSANERFPCGLQPHAENADAMLSIVIPTHRQADLLRACLHAVVRHATAECEVVVVDDASPERRCSRVAEEFSAVRIVRLSRQGGFARAANVGIRASHGAIVELLNDDTEVQPGWADAALKPFADASVGAVAPLVLAWPDGKTIDSAGDRYYLGGIAGKRGHGEPLGAGYLRACPVFGASASSGFYRRAALDRVGLFPESFGSYFEDVDLAFRLQRAGYRAVFEPASRVLHHVSASYGRSSRRLIERQSCNEERVFWRNLPLHALLRALPRHAAVLAGKAWRRWDEGTLTPWLCGRLRVLGELRELLRHRHALAGITARADVDAWMVERRFWGALPTSPLAG